MARILTFMIVLLWTSLLNAKDFGIRGTTYPVGEESLLDHLQNKLKGLSEGTLLLKHMDVQRRVKASVQEPPPVPHIHKATVYRRYTYNPAITLKKDITDHQGRLIAPKGTTYNPLTHLQLRESLLVFDGSDPKQVAWAKEQGENTKWILVKGRPLEMTNIYDRPVYFDQGGALCRQFKIQAVPTKVTQEGPLLRLEEGIKEEESDAQPN